jgi:NADPH-dependent 7-cyano-7-deazaguanine reductase QueF
MTKSYKRKVLIEKNSRDSDRLDKRTKRAFEQSNRNSAKKEIEEELEQLSVDNKKEDMYYELEMEMSSLCYQLEKLDPDHKCTCPSPGNEDLARDHIAYMNGEILKRNKNE